MSPSAEGNRKIYQDRVKKDPDAMRKAGRLGGLAKNPNKGFGSRRDLAKKYGQLNGRKNKK